MVLPIGVPQLGTFKGAKGDTGPKGDTGTIASASAASVAAGQAATVTMTGPQTARHAAFQIPRGLPGVNAVENDEAVAEYVTATDSETRGALDATFASREVENSIPGQMQEIVSRINAGMQDVRILIYSDSTAQMSGSWAQQLPHRLAELFPDHGVRSYLINDTDPITWDFTQVSTGTPEIYVYNCSFAGRTWDYGWDLTRRSLSVDVTRPDLIMFAHGHNDNFSQAQVNNLAAIRGKMLAVTEDMRTWNPDAGVVLLSQNPLLASDRNKASGFRADMYRRYARDMGFGFIDIHKAFIDSPAPLTDLVSGDGVHPTAAGHALWLEEVVKRFAAKPNGQVAKQEKSSFESGARNLLPTVKTFTDGSLPAGWTGSGVTAGTSTVRETGTKALSLSTGSGTAVGQFVHELPMHNFLRGKWVTFAVRLYSVAGSNNSAGRVQLHVKNGAGDWEITFSEFPQHHGQYQWRVLSVFVPSSSLGVRVVINTHHATGTDTVLYLDRVTLCVGRYPTDDYGV